MFLYTTPCLKIQFLCDKVAARLLQSCHKIETVLNPKLLYTRLRTGIVARVILCALLVVATLCNNLCMVTRLPQPCRKLGIFLYGLFLLVYLSVYSALFAAA